MDSCCCARLCFGLLYSLSFLVMDQQLAPLYVQHAFHRHHTEAGVLANVRKVEQAHDGHRPAKAEAALRVHFESLQRIGDLVPSCTVR